MPVALLFHGGGWVSGDKDEIALDVLPYLAMGFAMANVDYRLARVATAPAAVEDSRCALRWVIRHAKQYGLNVDRLILVGGSAGAHLALMAALVPATAGFDNLCPGDEPLKVAAVINCFGVIDVGGLLAPPNTRDFAVGWIGNASDPAALARRVSPISYVHKGARRSSPPTERPIQSCPSPRRAGCTRPSPGPVSPTSSSLWRKAVMGSSTAPTFCW